MAVGYDTNFHCFCGVARIPAEGIFNEKPIPKLLLLSAMGGLGVYSHIGGGLIAHVGYICYTLKQLHAWDATSCMQVMGQTIQHTVSILNNPRFMHGSSFPPPWADGVAQGHVSASGNKSHEAAASHTDGLRILLEGMLVTVIGALGASAGVVRVLSPCNRKLQIAGAVGLPAGVYQDESVVDIDCGVCGQASSDRGIHLSDSAVCVHRSGHPFFSEGHEHVVAAPLEYGGNLLGVVTVFFSASIPQAAASSMRPFAQMISIALEGDRKNAESQRSRLMAERQAMANEIHDSLAQTLYYARMRMGLLLEGVRTHNEQLALKCASDVDEALGNGQKSMREIITHFRCQMDPLGLRYALQTLVDGFCERTEITFEYANLVADLELPLEFELQVFHIVREALANIATHSGATYARLLVSHSDGHYYFVIEDNGAGCDGAPTEGHYGLMIMRERALRIGGEIAVETAAGLGTRVQLKFSDSED